MPSDKKEKDEAKPQPKKKNDPSSKSKLKPPSEQQEQNEEIKKKASKEGFSILGSLAKFMARDKPTSAPQLQPLPETIEEAESAPKGPEYNEVSSQTSELSIRRSSTLKAVSKAVEALKEVRQRVTVMAKTKQSTQTLQPEGTQTSNSLLPTIENNYDPHLLSKSTNLHDNHHGPMRSGYYSDNVIAVSQPIRPALPQSHASFHRNPHYHDTSGTRSGPSKRTGNRSPENISDDDSFDSSEILFHSTPKPGKGKSKGRNEEHHLRPSSKNVNFQTEPEREIKGTQTLLRAINNSNADDSPDIENSLARKILADREKCPKCDLFELMFLHGGEKVLNDEEMLGMFKRHMNSHLLKAQGDLNKPYKWSGKVTDIEDVAEQRPNRSKSSADRRQGDMAPVHARTNDYTDNNTNGRKYHENEVASIVVDNKLGTPPPGRQVNAGNDENGESIEENSYHFSETKEAKRAHRLKRAPSPPFEQILKTYLSSIKADRSDETIIQGKHFHTPPRHYRHDSFNDYDDGYYYPENNGDSYRSRSDKRYNKKYEKDTFDNGTNGHCFCDRTKCIPDPYLINSGDWDTNEDECNYKCVGTSASSHFHNPDDLNEMESNVKWFIKGMLMALNGHHNVNSGEGNRSKRHGSPSNTRYEEDGLGKAANDFRGTEKAKSFPEAEKQPSDPPVEGDEKSRTETGKGRNREGSVLSTIGYFLVQEDVKNRSNDDQKNGVGAEPESSSVKQDMKKELNSGQHAQTEDNSPPSPGANKSESKSRIQNGKSGGGGNGLVHKNFHLSDSKVQELAQDILSAFCTDFSGHGGSSLANGCETPSELLSCSATNSDEIVQQVCSILKAKIAKTRAPARDFNNSEGKGHDQGSRSSERHRTTCSYFYSLSNDNTSSNTCNRACYSNQTEACCPRQRQNIDCTYGQLPLQETFRQRYNAMCYQQRRVKTRQECMSNGRRERECEQRRCRQSPVQAFTNSSRPSTAATQPRGNIFCGCSINTPTTRDRNPCETFTYVVPQTHMYWQYLDQ